MSFIRDFNRDLVLLKSEIKYEIVKWFRPLKLTDIIDENLEYNDVIQIKLKDVSNINEENIINGLVMEIIGDRMLIYKSLENFKIETIYPEEIDEIIVKNSSSIKNEIKKNRLVLREVILDYPLIIDNYITVKIT